MQNHVHTLIIGSGAAGLATALHLWRLGISDILIATESLAGGTSINTGSDKQTYYKMSCCGAEADSVREMAQTYFEGGSMHGDLALAEAAGSLRAFMNLVELGVPFPRDDFGQFAGYKTDHDPRQRATSCGPYTSREMCRALIREVRRLEIPVMEGLFVKKLLTKDISDAPDGQMANTPPSVSRKQVFGAAFLDLRNHEHTIYAQNVVFAVGGPGGLYQTSVYPQVQLGAIGVALQAGAVAQNLPESQFGMASTAFRWNVSGTYMQCVPRFISTAKDGSSDVQEFFVEHAATEKLSAAELHSLIFLKGYQWPFDAKKIREEATGRPASSILDIWVYEETVLRNRRAFLDFRQNPLGFHPTELSSEARTYLENSGALTLPTPFTRLEKMNPSAIQLYADHGIDIARQPLEIAVCAQHNNGGLAADIHWQSVNLRRLFPVGEVNGSHGVYRPGGSALNSGQVGAVRVAECIARLPEVPLPGAVCQPETGKQEVYAKKTDSENTSSESWRHEREIFQARMSCAGAFIRSEETLRKALCDACTQYQRLSAEPRSHAEMEPQRNLSLLMAQRLYLDAIRFQVESGVGSRGSAVVLAEHAPSLSRVSLLPCMFTPENPAFRQSVLESWLDAEGATHHRWVPCREVPEPDTWFENVWAKFREKNEK